MSAFAISKNDEVLGVYVVARASARWFLRSHYEIELSAERVHRPFQFDKHGQLFIGARTINPLISA
jgi:hypothetical protein